MRTPLRAVVVGCGGVAPNHVSALRHLHRDTGLGMLVATVDRDVDRARDLAAGCPDVSAHDSLEAALQERRPDVVHIVTPPPTHVPLALQAVRAGAHVLVEKPLALDVGEADRLLETAAEAGVTVSTCHNYLFKPSIVRARELVAGGEIGEVVGVSAYYGVSGESGTYTPDRAGDHWAWRLPGGVFTNFLPHMLYLVEAFAGPLSRVAEVVVTPQDGPPTELGLLALSESAVVGITVSLRTRPYAKSVEVRGTAGTIRADLVREVCTIQRDRDLPGAVEKVAFSLSEASQLVRGTGASAWHVARGEWQRMPGLHELVRKLYAGLVHGGPAPVTGLDGRRTVALLEQVQARLPGPAPAVARPRPQPATDAERAVADVALGRVLVTGATGFLGARLVAALDRAGASVVALARDQRSVPFAVEQCSEVVQGSLEDRGSLLAAAKGAELVVHAAAVTTNAAPYDVHHRVNVDGTRHVLEAAREAGVPRVVHVSSVVVYGLARTGTVDEDAGYGTDDDPWAHYLRSKRAADELALGHHNDHGMAVVVVRPGILYGPGHPMRPGLMRSRATTVLVGPGHNHLPWTHVDGAVDAILLAGVVRAAAGQAFNVVDEPQRPLRDVIAAAGGRRRLVGVPTSLLLSAARALEWRAERQGDAAAPRLTRFVVNSAARDLVYDTTRARQVLDWVPRPSPGHDSPAQQPLVHP